MESRLQTPTLLVVLGHLDRGTQAVRDVITQVTQWQRGAEAVLVLLAVAAMARKHQVLVELASRIRLQEPQHTMQAEVVVAVPRMDRIQLLRELVAMAVVVREVSAETVIALHRILAVEAAVLVEQRRRLEAMADLASSSSATLERNVASVAR